MDTGMEYVGNCKLSGINPGETWLPQSKPGKVIPIHCQSGGESSHRLPGKAGLDEAKAPAPAPWSWCPSRARAVLIPRHPGHGSPRSTPLPAQFRPYALPCTGATLPLGEVVLEDPQPPALRSRLPGMHRPVPSRGTGLLPTASPPREPALLRRPLLPRMVRLRFAALGTLPGERAAVGGQREVWGCRSPCSPSWREAARSPAALVAAGCGRSSLFSCTPKARPACVGGLFDTEEVLASFDVND